MKPEGRKSPIADPVKQKKLSTLMKPQLKTKSPESNFNKSSKTSLVANQLLSEVEVISNRRNRLTRQAGSSRLVNLPRSNISKSQANIQSTSSHSLWSQSQDNFKQLTTSVKKEHEGPFVKPITPKIMITKCSKLEKLVENKEMILGKKVLRKKVSSPVNKVDKVGSKKVEYKALKDKIIDHENQLKRKDLEIQTQNRKISSIKKIVNDKEKVIKNLESKFPKMLADLKKGLNDEKKANVELKETIKRNKQLSGDRKLKESHIRLKDDKLKEVTAAKNSLMEELKAKDLELNNFRQRLENLEKKLPDLLGQVERKEDELNKCHETIEFLEERIVFQSEENNNHNAIIADLKTRLDYLSDEVLFKENEIMDLRSTNYELQRDLLEQNQNIEKTDLEAKNYLDVLDGIRTKIDSGPVDAKKLHDSIDCLDKATDDFLNKVSTVSKDRNMSFNLKLTIKKTRNRGSLTEKSSDKFGGLLLNQSYLNNNSTRLSLNSLHHSTRNSDHFSPKKLLKMSCHNSANMDKSGEEVFFSDEVFEKCSLLNLKELRPREASESSMTSDSPRDEYEVSSDTCQRFEALDDKVRLLWSKLSTRDESFEDFKSDKKVEFSNSVSKLKDDLSESIEHHNQFMKQVSVAKKLFSTPIPTKYKE